MPIFRDGLWKGLFLQLTNEKGSLGKPNFCDIYRGHNFTLKDVHVKGWINICMLEDDNSWMYGVLDQP